MIEVPWRFHEELTEADLASLPDDGHRYEIVDGSLVVSPAASSAHQLIARRLGSAVERKLPAGFEVMDNVNVRAGRSFLVPDLVVVPFAIAAKDVNVFDPGDVQLVVEIVSRSSVTMDRITKPALYAAAGIASYWRVERDHPGGVLLAAHELDDGVYRLVTEIVGDDEVVVERPFPIRIRPSDLVLPR